MHNSGQISYLFRQNLVGCLLHFTFYSIYRVNSSLILSDGLGDSGSEVASEDDCVDSGDIKKQSIDIPTSDEPDVKKQRTN